MVVDRFHIGFACAVTCLSYVATVAAEGVQSGRSPSPCSDPIAGVLRGQKYNADAGYWVIYTLRIRRPAAGSTHLTGTIGSESWSGGPSESRPPACRADLRHFHVRMRARGRFSADGSFDFEGTSVHIERNHCNDPDAFDYRPDHFRGRLDQATRFLQTTNSDGGAAVNAPTVFQRVRCDL